ncbi:MAG: hypothetical protein V7636_657, partial [Actinomycetota bacterium]
ALEFGAGTDVRVKEGLTAGGPYSLQLGARHPAQVKVGLVGTRDALERTSAFLELMQVSVPTLGDKQLQRPPFPGFASTFHSELLVDSSWQHVIDDDILNRALAQEPEIAFRDLLKAWTAGLEQLSQHRDPPPSLIVCAIPGEVLKHCHRVHLADAPAPRQRQLGLFDDPTSIEAVTGPDGLLDRDFRRALKASAMRFSAPIQIVTPNLYGPIPGRHDDPASRAWNLAVALFYKAGGAPWRVASPEVDTLYVGISFHHRWHQDGHTLYAGLAQAFYPGSEGFALRGGEAEKAPEDLRLRLAPDEMRRLVSDVLEHYRSRTAKDPRRVVIFKTTAFDDGERHGAALALDNIPKTDFIALRSSVFRLLRQGDYPPARGTLTTIGTRGFLLTTGYQANRQTYKGSHIPVPLDLLTESDLEIAATDVMALTKLNWNSAADHTQFPVTLAFAQKVGTIMAEVPEDQVPQTRLSYYI